MLYYEEPPLVPGLPGVDDVTDGSVDYFDMDWENVENGVTEEEMQKMYDRDFPVFDKLIKDLSE